MFDSATREHISAEERKERSKRPLRIGRDGTAGSYQGHLDKRRRTVVVRGIGRGLGDHGVCPRLKTTAAQTRPSEAEGESPEL